MGKNIRTVEEKRQLYVQLAEANIQIQTGEIKNLQQKILNYTKNYNLDSKYDFDYIECYCKEAKEALKKIEKNRETIKLLEALKEEE